MPSDVPQNQISGPPMGPVDIHVLPRPGSALFFQTLITQLHAAAPGFPLDPVIIQAILLCLLAGDKNLILRTHEEDVNIVYRLAASILTFVFGYTTHKLKIHTDAKSLAPHRLLRDIFLPSLASVSNNEHLGPPSHKRRESQHQRRSSSSRTSIPNRPSRPGSTYTSRSRRTSFPRSASFSKVSQIDVGNAESKEDSDYFGHTVYSSRHHAPQSETQIHASPTIIPGSNDDWSQHEVSRANTSLAYAAEPSRAVVVSGLEYVSLRAQRALAQTLRERRLVIDKTDTYTSTDTDENIPEGKWSLSDDFIMVYVCRVDNYERPMLEKSLLDKFAMSTTITLHPSNRVLIRQHSAQHRASSLSTPISAAHPLPSTTATHSLPTPSAPLLPHSQHPTQSHPQATSPTNPLLPAYFLGALRRLAQSKHTFVHPSLDLYTSDLLAATRHHHELDGMLLTVNVYRDIVDLARAGRILGSDLTGTELIIMFAKLEEQKHAANNAGHHEDALGSIGSNDMTAPVVSVPRTNLDEDDCSQMHNGPLEHPDLPPRLRWEDYDKVDVSEADIARIFPRVVSHRLRVRDSPEDEVFSSLVLGAVKPWSVWASDARNKSKDQTKIDVPGDEGLRGEMMQQRPQWQRRTVKDILVHILAEV